MLKVLKWVGIILGSLVLLIAAGIGVAFAVSSSKLKKEFTVPSDTVTIPTDGASIDRGRYLAEAVGQCVDCHEKDLAGGKVIDDPVVARLYGPNLTRGEGGVTKAYTDADWVRAIRHGVDPKGRALIIMPSETFINLSREDLGAIIAYVKSVPPVDRETPSRKLGPLMAVLTATGQADIQPATYMDHSKPFPVAVASGATVEYGRYVAAAAGCSSCHGEGFSGGKIPGGPPDAPPASNITPTGLQSWSEADFITAMRTGERPDGTMLNEFMPWKAIARMTDDELKALWAYLRTVPPKETGNR